MKRLPGIGLLLIGLLCFSSIGESGKTESKPKDKAPEMTPGLQPLWRGDAPGAKGKGPVDIPGVMVYAPKNPNGAVIVVCPGGGYGGLAMDHEGKQIGAWLNTHGITGVVLKYRLGARYNHPIPLGDAQDRYQARWHSGLLRRGTPRLDRWHAFRRGG